MSHKALRRFLDHIERGKPINLPRFYILIRGLQLSHRFVKTDISAVKEGHNAYLVTDMHEALKAELSRLATDLQGDLDSSDSPASLEAQVASPTPEILSSPNRISAARQNQSHAHKVMGSYLLLQQGDAHPLVITFDHQGNYTLPAELLLSANSDSQDVGVNDIQPNDIQHNDSKGNGLTIEETTAVKASPVASPTVKRNNRLAPEALLLENRQLFLDSAKTLAFLQHHSPFASDNFDIIFSAGNEISNTLHRAFLAQYQRLYCCFDFDLGGVSTASNLMRLLPDTPCELLIPDDLDARLANVVERVSTQYVHEVRCLASAEPRLAPIATLISKHHKVLEQESLLHD